MIRLVRELALDILYKKTGTSLACERLGLGMTMAFAWAISKEREGSQLKRLARVSLPFWVVQVSPSNSLLLSAVGSSSREFTFEHERRLSEARRMISADINEPKDLPDVVQSVLSTMDDMETVTKTIRNLCDPYALIEVGKNIDELDSNHSIFRVEQTFSSQHALAESESFQKIRDDLLARVGRMEELQTLIDDHLRGHLKVLENLVSMEKRKWDERVKSMQTSTEAATHDLESKKSDELYSLRDEFRKTLRAKTAEFARASTDIESYFTKLLEHVKATRISIVQKGDDIEKAVEEYQQLAKYLTDALPRFEEILEALNQKSTEVLEDARRVDASLASKAGATTATVDSEIDERKKRLMHLENERQTHEKELNELLSLVVSSIDRMEGRIKKRLMDYQSEVLNLQRSTLENESIRDLAPLTHLDIFLMVADYSDGQRQILPPGLAVEDRFGIPVSFQSMNKSLEKFIIESITMMNDSDASFQSRFDAAVSDGNLFDEPDNFDVIETGLKDLQFRQLLQEDAYETIIRTLKRCMNR